MSIKKLFTIFLVCTVSVFSAFSAPSSQVSKSEWNKAIEATKCSTVKYSVNIYMDKLNIGNVSGSLKLANTKFFLNTNLSVSSSVDGLLQNIFGDTLSGEYNFYAAWSEGDEITLDELKYTTKNSNKYTDIKDSYLLKEVMNSVNSSFSEKGEDEDDSYGDLIKAIGNFENYEYKNGKYSGSFQLKSKDDTMDVNVSLTFNSKKVSTIEAEVVDSTFSNPLTSGDSVLKFVLKGYVYNIGKTAIVLN